MCRASLKTLFAALLLGASLAAAAQTSTPAKKPAAALPAAATASTPAPRAAAAAKPTASERLRPTGPVTVTATSVDWAKNGMMVYTGNVKLSSDTLNLDGDRLELEQQGDGQYRAKITGKPAHLTHSGDTDEQGQPQPPVTARGNTLIYDSKNGMADVTGDAKVTRGEDEITGETIHYNVNERRIQAAGGTGGQVRIVIQPASKDRAATPPKATKP